MSHKILLTLNCLHEGVSSIVSFFSFDFFFYFYFVEIENSLGRGDAGTILLFVVIFFIRRQFPRHHRIKTLVNCVRVSIEIICKLHTQQKNDRTFDDSIGVSDSIDFFYFNLLRLCNGKSAYDLRFAKS